MEKFYSFLNGTEKKATVSLTISTSKTFIVNKATFAKLNKLFAKLKKTKAAAPVRRALPSSCFSQPLNKRSGTLFI